MHFIDIQKIPNLNERQLVDRYSYYLYTIHELLKVESILKCAILKSEISQFSAKECPLVWLIVFFFQVKRKEQESLKWVLFQ